MAKRVYFAFHYQDVIDFRANVVRKHNFIGGGDSGEGEHRFRREAERRSGAKANSSRSEATLAW
jgi:hypothetical protein